MHRLPYFAVLITLSSLLASCASVGSALDVPGGRALKSASPAPFRVAVAEVAVELDSQEAFESEDVFAMPLRRVNRALAKNLRVLCAATEIIEIPRVNDLDLADEQGADLLLRPRITRVHFERVGASNGAWLSGLLWITTWIGGLLIGDTHYAAHLEVEWDVINPHTEQRIDTFANASGDVALNFFDRHEGIEWSSLQSFVLPPFWTFDDEAKTKSTLTRYALAVVACKTAEYLKSALDGDEKDLLGHAASNRLETESEPVRAFG